MRTFDKRSRFQADSLPEIRRALDQMALDLKPNKVGNRTISEGHVANAALLALLSLPREERYRVVVDGFKKLNELMAIDDPGASPERVEAILYGESNPGRVIVPESTPEPAANVPRKRKGAG